LQAARCSDIAHEGSLAETEIELKENPVSHRYGGAASCLWTGSFR
jgi:hypothetical protein